MKKEDYEKLYGKTRNLIDQVDKIFKMNNQKGIKTRYRYRDGEYRFCKWLGANTNLQKIKNVKAKHFIKYTEELKANGSSSYIKAELSSIRHFHALTNSKETLPPNERLDLPKNNFGGVQRGWENDEVKAALDLADKMGRIDMAMAIKIAYAFGCRPEETVTLTVKQIKEGIKNRQLDLINTKGNRPRGIAVDPISKMYNMQLRALQFALENAKSSDKVFIPTGKPTHTIKKSIQNWFYNNRDKFQHKDRIHRNVAREIVRNARDNKQNIVSPKVYLTAHGLRHSYAHILYKEIVEHKLTEERSRSKKHDKDKEVSKEKIREIKREARKTVSKLLGHNRDDITRIYTPK